MKAVGLNFADIFACQVILGYSYDFEPNFIFDYCGQGLYSATPKGEFTPGLEFAGEIIEVGDLLASENPPNLKVGDRVIGVRNAV